MNRTTAGGIAGTVGVVAMVGVITTLRRVLLADDQLAESRTHPEKIVQRMADVAGAGELSGRIRRRLGDLIHFGYGAAWGIAIARFTRGRTVYPWRHGIPLAAGLWTFGFIALLPSLGAHPGPWTWKRREFVLTGSAHLAYGVATAATLAALSND